MKMKRIVAIISLSLVIFNCENNEDIIRDLSEDIPKNNYLIIGDTTNCEYISGNPIMSIYAIQNVRVYDSIDVDNDFIYDFVFNFVYQYDDCSDFVCDSGIICDCWPINYKYQGFINHRDFEAAYDTVRYYPLRFIEQDTISGKNIWVNQDFNCLRSFGFGGGNNGHWKDATNGYLGIRKTKNNDTCYGWIYIEYTVTNLEVKKI